MDKINYLLDLQNVILSIIQRETYTCELLIISFEIIRYDQYVKYIYMFIYI